MSTQTPSTQQEYDALPLGTNRPTFAIFGNSSKETVLQACRELHLNAFQTMSVEDVWTRHPYRQGTILCMMFFPIYLLFP
jgi:hypothetical protein